MSSDVKVDVKRTHFSSNYTIIGQEAAVKEWCARLIRSYHPAGYGTYCRFVSNNLDGTVTYNAHRANSCD